MVMTPDNIDTFAGLKIDDGVNVAPGLFMAIYGTGGGGKTTLASEIVLSEYGTPAIIADVEGGSSSVTHLRKDGLTIVHPITWTDLKNLKKALEKRDCPYKSVIFDNMS